MTPNQLAGASLSDLAVMIKREWTKPYFGAVPYIDAMVDSDADGSYGLDSAASLISYFLGNATTWRGETAKAFKAELKRRLSTQR